MCFSISAQHRAEPDTQNEVFPMMLRIMGRAKRPLWPQALCLAAIPLKAAVGWVLPSVKNGPDAQTLQSNFCASRETTGLAGVILGPCGSCIFV